MRRRAGPGGGPAAERGRNCPARRRSELRSEVMDQPSRKEKSKVKEPVSRVEKAKQKSAQQELKQRQRAEFHPRCLPCVIVLAASFLDYRHVAS
ncbi:small vasohibin-binding protein isoform X2 [Ailuropoda melanoleuca]|uniref:small vasohibin-binding protein isoform X2 n=1 Tax=Ailuropoda melanoleuca TaxID=9646 RepID=UPI0014948C3A|nr:small vasohibin-binding protein isoform X2 [Ailuropoda melanoleuca]